MRSLAVLASVLLLTSCTSYFKRQTCEKTNWYDYGFNKAMQGQRLTGDAFIGECKTVESKIDHAALDTGFKAGMASYCTPEIAMQKGEAGEGFNYNFCDSNITQRLKLQFKVGRDRLCQSGGYQFGAEGKKYSGQCVSNNEAGFLVKYKKGRYKFLQNEINLAREEQRQIDSQIWGLKNDVLSLQNQKLSLGSGVEIVHEQIYDPNSRTYRTEVKQSQDQNVQWEKDRLDNQIRSKRAEITSKEQRKQELQNKVSDLQREMTTIER